MQISCYENYKKKTLCWYKGHDKNNNDWPQIVGIDNLIKGNR